MVELDTIGDKFPELRSFGRKHGRKPSPRQERLLRDVLPRVSLDLSNPPLQPLTQLFEAVSDTRPLPAFGRTGQTPPPSGLWLEIGFGGAEHLVWQATRNPGVALIGCEPFEGGVIKALAAIETQRLSNIRIHPDDARPLLRWLPPASLDRVFILFPDPWPKTRHIKRRLVAKPLLDQLARTMKPGAELRFASDIGDYVRTALLSLMNHGQFHWPAESHRDWRERPADWPETRYEAKAIREGRRRYFFRLTRA